MCVCVYCTVKWTPCLLWHPLRTGGSCVYTRPQPTTIKQPMLMHSALYTTHHQDNHTKNPYTQKHQGYTYQYKEMIPTDSAFEGKTLKTLLQQIKYIPFARHFPQYSTKIHLLIYIQVQSNKTTATGSVTNLMYSVIVLGSK